MVIMYLLSLYLLASLFCGKGGATSTEEDTSRFDFGKVVFVINSQKHHLHKERAEDKRTSWLSQLYPLMQDLAEPEILLASDDWAPAASWTILPLLPKLKKKYEQSNVNWFFFATEETNIDFVNLGQVLSRYDPQQDWFLGHALKDVRPTIIHHYAKSEGRQVIAYPNFPSGWLLSAPLLKRVADISEDMKIDFNIDPPFEIALLIKHMNTVDILNVVVHSLPKSENGILLTHLPELCVSSSGKNCATFYSQKITQCGDSVKLEDVLFAVKTFSGFHEKRLPVIQETWGDEAGSSVAYFSDLEDPQYGTVYQGVPNSPKGHCGKTFAIIKKMNTEKRYKNKSWVIITDDDTLVSVPRMLKFLSCYDPNEALMIGEAYGFHAHKDGGYSYLTGGGGMVMSRKTLSVFDERATSCTSDDHPDDMILGSYARYYNISLIFSPLFHQDQPESYPISVLRQKEPISFHRHFPDDPYNIYTSYLAVESTEDTDVQEPVEKQRRKCKSKETSTLMDLLEDEDLKKLLPPGYEEAVLQYQELAEQFGEDEDEDCVDHDSPEYKANKEADDAAWNSLLRDDL